MQKEMLIFQSVTDGFYTFHPSTMHLVWYKTIDTMVTGVSGYLKSSDEKETTTIVFPTETLIVYGNSIPALLLPLKSGNVVDFWKNLYDKERW
jgi:hypothetical protein